MNSRRCLVAGVYRCQIKNKKNNVYFCNSMRLSCFKVEIKSHFLACFFLNPFLSLSAREQASVTIDEIYQEIEESNNNSSTDRSEVFDGNDIKNRLESLRLNENDEEESPFIKQGYHFDLKETAGENNNDIDRLVNLGDFPNASLLHPIDGLTDLDDLHPQDQTNLRVFALTDLHGV